MPRVPVYHPDQIAPARPVSERLRAADNSGGVLGGLGAGIVSAGKSVGNAAQVQSEIEFDLDDTARRELTLEYRKRAAEIVGGFTTQQGRNAVTARGDTDKALKSLRAELEARASNTRQAKMFGESVDPYFADDGLKVGSHAVGEARKMRSSTLAANVDQSKEDVAANWDRPDIAAKHIETGLSVLNDLAEHEGWAPEVAALKAREFKSDAHTAVVDRLLISEDIEGASAYLNAHADEVEAKDESSLRERLAGPLKLRVASDDYRRAVGMVAPSEPSKGGVSEFDAILKNEGGTDSRGNFRTSPAGAIGPAQVMPGTAPEAARLAGVPFDNTKYRTDAAYNRKLGQAYYEEMKRQFNGDTEKAAAAYNAGPGSASKGTGVRGAMARAERAGEPANWKKYLPAETQKYVEKFNKQTGGQNAPRRWDLNAVYGNIDNLAEKEGWTLERREAAKRFADQEVRRDEALKERQEDAASRQADEITLKLGDNFKSTTQIPHATWANLPASERLRLTKQAEANSAPKAVEANGAVHTNLRIMAVLDPAGFTKQRLGQYAGQMTNSELEELAVDQARVLKEGMKGPTVSLNSDISSAISLYGKGGGFDYSKRDNKQQNERYLDIHSRMHRDLSALTGGKRNPTDAEVKGAYSRAIINQSAREGKTFGEVLPQNLRMIPNETIERIKREYRAATGGVPDNSTIYRTYYQFLGTKW